MPTREEITNTENNAMYELLRELLNNLARLNWGTTRDIIMQKLDKQVPKHTINDVPLQSGTGFEYWRRGVHTIEPSTLQDYYPPPDTLLTLNLCLDGP